MHQPIYDQLKRVAAAGRTTTYGEIAPLADLDMCRPDHRNRMSEILDEISSHEHSAGRPLLSVVVVRSQGDGAGTPGPGFYTLGRRLGVHKGGDDVTFFAGELIRAHSQWKPATSA